MNGSGYGRVAYQLMAYATGYCRRTAIRHMHRLVTLGIFAKTVYRLANGYAINLYKCLLPREAFYRAAPQSLLVTAWHLSSRPQDRRESAVAGGRTGAGPERPALPDQPDSPDVPGLRGAIAALEALPIPHERI